MAKRPTLAEIAKAAGFSRSTVAYILNGAPEHITFSPETRSKVETIARDLGYRASAAARATATGKTRCAALLQAHGHLPESLLWCIHDRLAERGWHLVIGRMPDPALATGDHVPRMLTDWLADGLLVVSDEPLPAGIAALVKQNGIPCITIGSPLEQDCVLADHQRAGREVTEHLLRKKYRRIAFTGQTGTFQSDARFRGYAGALEAAGGRLLHLPEAEALAVALAHGEAPEALVMAGDDPPPTGGIPAVGFIWQRPVPSGLIAAWLAPAEALGVSAVDHLLARMESSDLRLPPLVLPGTIITT